MYCSLETRKVIDCLDEYGLTVPVDEYLGFEHMVGRYWNTHIQKVIADILAKGGASSLGKAELAGPLTYFRKPIESMLKQRGAAHRTEPVVFEITPDIEQIYRMVTTELLLADFNMKELSHLVIDVPPMAGDITRLFRSIQACRQQNVRSVYYLHGVLRREYQTHQGKIREIQQQAAVAEDTGWTVPEDYEKMDITERRELAADWQDLLNSIKITKSLNEL